MVETTSQYAKKCLILNRSISVRSQYLKPFVWKQISSYSFKNRITNKLFTYKPYIYNYLTVCKQMTVKLWLLVLHSNIWNHLTVCKQMTVKLNC